MVKRLCMYGFKAWWYHIYELRRCAIDVSGTIVSGLRQTMCHNGYGGKKYDEEEKEEEGKKELGKT